MPKVQVNALQQAAQHDETTGLSTPVMQPGLVDSDRAAYAVSAKSARAGQPLDGHVESAGLSTRRGPLPAGRSAQLLGLCLAALLETSALLYQSLAHLPWLIVAVPVT